MTQHRWLISRACAVAAGATWVLLGASHEPTTHEAVWFVLFGVATLLVVALDGVGRRRRRSSARSLLGSRASVFVLVGTAVGTVATVSTGLGPAAVAVVAAGVAGVACVAAQLPAEDERVRAGSSASRLGA